MDYRTDCNVSKMCMFKPRGCNPNLDCTLGVVLETIGPNKLKVQMVAQTIIPPVQQQYVAIAFSHDTIMGDDSVTECVLSDMGQLVGYEPEVFLSYNKGKSNDRVFMNDDEHAIVFTDLRGEVVDGRVACEFVEQIVPQIDNKNGLIWNLNKDYYLMAATGSAQPDEVNAHEMNHESHFFPMTSTSQFNPSTFANNFTHPANFVPKIDISNRAEKRPLRPTTPPTATVVGTHSVSIDHTSELARFRSNDMASQVGAITSVNALISRVFVQPKGDLTDRLNSRITVCILAVSSVLMMSTHFFGDPITCWTPAQFTKQWVDFVNQYCYVHGTYFAPFTEQLSFEDDERKKATIQYYQWVPYILAVQAVFFYLPRFMWKSMIAYSGYDLAGAVKYVDRFWNSIRDQDAAFKTRLARFEGQAAVYIWEGLRLARMKRSRDMALFYTLATVIQFINAWIQFYIINSLLDSPTYTFWGPGLLSDILQGNDWQTTGHFPRVVHCDFNRRRTASVQLDTVLCVLTYNIYYEKLLLFLWFWFAVVAIWSTINSMAWIYRLCSTVKTQKMIENYLGTAPVKAPVSDEVFFRALGTDGMFVMQQMALNLGDIPASYLTIAMRNICPSYLDTDDDYDENTPLTIVKTVRNT
ncbi:unnamed protein product [Caenorhabditis bovis]|uniref:Innexin n=1 Tax=Caenorhabditis bovis TaxID=2654633 RepID=A0A8S1ERD5_9PELO|nr:unnamed protein product [Caenorhabditis bovis]